MSSCCAHAVNAFNNGMLFLWRFLVLMTGAVRCLLISFNFYKRPSKSAVRDRESRDQENSLKKLFPGCVGY